MLVGHAVGDLDRADVGVGHAEILGLAAGKAAQHVRVAEQARRRLAHRLAGDLGVGVRGVAERVQLPLAEPAGAARDRERHDDAVALLELRDGRPDLDDLAHRLVAEDVARLHRRHVAVVEVEVGAADGGRGDLDDHVARILDLRVGDGVDPDVALAVPANRPH